MLGKLMKHEIKATGKILLPLYIIMLLLSLVNRAFLNIEVLQSTPLKIIGSFVMIAFVSSIIASLSVTFIVMILRFYKNLMSDEGYLMFTLPVKSSHLINSKLIVSVMWNIVSVLVVLASLFILLISPENFAALREAIPFYFDLFMMSFEGSRLLVIIEFVVMTFISLVQQILLIYVSIAIGHLFSGHRVLGSFASYIAINTIIQIVTTVLLVIIVRLSNSSLEQMETVPEVVFLFTIVFSSILTALYYIGTNYILSKKLNLE